MKRSAICAERAATQWMIGGGVVINEFGWLAALVRHDQQQMFWYLHHCHSGGGQWDALPEWARGLPASLPGQSLMKRLRQDYRK